MELAVNSESVFNYSHLRNVVVNIIIDLVNLLLLKILHPGGYSPTISNIHEKSSLSSAHPTYRIFANPLLRYNIVVRINKFQVKSVERTRVPCLNDKLSGRSLSSDLSD